VLTFLRKPFSNSGITVPPNNPIDLQSLKLIDFHLLRWSAQQRLFTVFGTLTSMLKTSAQLRLENLALRQQLAVLRRSKTLEADASRPDLLGLVATRVERLEIRPDDRKG
jgi:hypothetical protein